MGRPLMAAIELKYLHSFKDRHDHQRHYFRRYGKRIAISGEPGSASFMAAYHAALGKEPERIVPVRTVERGSFKELALTYFESPHFQSLRPSSKGNYRRIIEGFLVAHGSRRVDQFRRKHVIKILGGMAGTPSAASVLLKRIRTLIRFAIELEWIDVDPTHKVRSYRSNEIHTWTDEELAIYEKRWAKGTKQRLGYALFLYTGQRGSDVARMGRPDIAGDTIRVVQQKTGEKLTITLHPELQAELALWPARHIALLTTEYGRPFSIKGFGNFMSDAIRAAGLPERCKPHGLRKAAARRLAEAECTGKQIMSLTGHKTLAEVERYTRAAEQERLNRQAVAKQSENDGWQPQGRMAKPKRQPR